MMLPKFIDVFRSYLSAISGGGGARHVTYTQAPREESYSTLFNMVQSLVEKGLERSPGRNELFFMARRINSFYGSFAVAGLFNKELTPQLVYRVLRQMVLKYSILTVSYDKETNKIRPVKRLLYSDLVEYKDMEIDYTQMLYDLDGYSFELDGESPLFKVVIYNKKCLAVVFEHSFFDGGSGPLFLEIFLKYMKNQDLGVTYDLEVPIFDLERDIDALEPLTLAAEGYVRHEPDLVFLSKKLLKSILPTSIGRFIKDHSYTTGPPEGLKKWPKNIKFFYGQKTYFKLVNIAPDTMRSLSQKCRAKKITLTPYLEVMFYQSLYKMGLLDKDEYIHAMMPINLRRFIDKSLLDEALLGVKVYAGIFNFYTLNELRQSLENKDVFWQLVDRSHQCTKKSSEDRKLVMHQHYLYEGVYEEDSLDKFIEMNRQGYENSSGVSARFSNLGLVRNKAKDADWWLEDVIFTQNIGMNGGFAVINLVSTELTGMNCCISSLHQIWEDEAQFDRFCEAFIEGVKQGI